MSSSNDEHEVYGRENYKSRAHKLATLFIMTAGSANAREFPTMFIVNGGMPFLLAYLAFLGVVAFPIMHLESNLAQFAGDGNFGVFSTVPLFIGVGYTMSLYAIVHIVADSVPVSDQLHYLIDSLWETGGNECRNGVLLAPNRTCYVSRHTFSLCRSTRAQLAEAFRRQPLNQGMPVVESGSKGAHVVMVPPEVYRHDMAGCLPGVYNYLQPYQPCVYAHVQFFRLYCRRHAKLLEGSSSALSEIRAEPLLSLAAIWMVVFALAHQRFNTVKWILYMMVCIHVATTLLLLVRGATLPGAMSGLGTMLYTDWSYAVNLEMWSNALYVSLESVGVTGSIYLGIVRFNNFKNVYQRDVYFVLVADTATEVLRTAITFMFLGHLASTVGIDVRMLVGIESHVIVGILPQAMSVVPYQKLWSQVHALWLLSTMLPKFLIVPDIVIEVLTPAQPFLLLNRTLIYFFLCVSILMTSVIVCSPGGANVAAIIAHNHDQNLRFVVLFLESIVLLQFYGARRLDIACRMMTGRECGDFVKVCLASVIPIVVISLFLAKLTSKHWEGGNYPIWIYAVITWFWLVQLSFIPVFAVLLLNDQNVTLQNFLVPLPTWVPMNWELAMYYRKTLVVEGFDSNAVKNPEPRPRVQAPSQPPPKSSKRAKNSSGSKSSTEIMASDFVVASDRAYAVPGTDTPFKARAPRAGVDAQVRNGVASLSGTVHVTRRLSSVRRSARREKLEEEQVEHDESQQVGMPLVSEAEDPQAGRALAVPPAISSSNLYFKESSQVPGAVSPPSAELPEKLSPEESNISKEVQPAGTVRDDVRKKRFGPGYRGALHEPADEQPAVEDATSSTAAPKALLDKLHLAPSTTDGVHEKPKETRDKLPSKQSATQGIEKPANVAPPQAPQRGMLIEWVEIPERGAAEQPHAGIVPKKSRQSTEKMLLLNTQIPAVSQQGGLESGVHTRPLSAPEPSAVPETMEGVLINEQREGQAAPLKADEPQSKVKQQRGEMGAVGGPEQRVAARPDSAGKNVVDGRHNLRARRRRQRHLAERQAAARRRSVHYKPCMAMLPVQDDMTYLRGPPGGASVKQGEQGAPGEAQGVLTQCHEPRRKSVGQEGSSSSRNSSKSVESAAKLASAENAPFTNAVKKPVRAENSPKAGKWALSISSVRSLGESSAVKRPPDVPWTKPNLIEDKCAYEDAAIAANCIPRSTVAAAEQLGADVEDRPQLPSTEEKAKCAPISEAKRQKEAKPKPPKKGHKRHHKKATG